MSEESDPSGDDEFEEDSEADEPAEDEGGLAEDDFVRLAYTARAQDSEQLVDTTDVEVAEEAGIDVEDRSFEPPVIAIGAGHLFPAVERALVGQEVGDTGTAEVPASEAFGEYDPDRVRTVSADSIPEDNRYAGGQVEIDGEHGHIQSIIGGRARVDFNHPLAGETIEYEFEILDQIEDRLSRARALLEVVIDADLELWFETEEVERPAEDAEDDDDPELETVELETLYIESVPQLAFNQQWMFRKRQIAQEIIDRIGVDRVIVQETIEGTGTPGGLEAALADVDMDAEQLEDALDDDQPVEQTPNE